MNILEIDKALADIVIQKQEDCKDRLAKLNKEQVTEKKAIQIELGMYTLCLNAGFLRNTKDGREKVLESRRAVISNILPSYPELKSVFDELGGDEQMVFVASLQAEIFIRNQLYSGYLTELETAEKANDAERIFELQIKIGAVESVFKAWEQWREENGIYLFRNNAKTKNTHFYLKANALIKKEIEKLEWFTDELDRNPNDKKERIAEYKCAKWRYAGVSAVHAMLYNCNRLGYQLKDTHYVISPVNELLKQREDYLTLYDNAREDEKSDYGLYYGMVAFANQLISESKDKLNGANDWERIELTERISGLELAKRCLNTAWENRKEYGE